MLHPSTLENAHENRNLTIINSLQIWFNPEDNFEILIFFGKMETRQGRETEYGTPHSVLGRVCFYKNHP